VKVWKLGKNQEQAIRLVFKTHDIESNIASKKTGKILEERIKKGLQNLDGKCKAALKDAKDNPVDYERLFKSIESMFNLHNEMLSRARQPGIKEMERDISRLQQALTFAPMTYCAIAESCAKAIHGKDAAVNLEYADTFNQIGKAIASMKAACGRFIENNPLEKSIIRKYAKQAGRPISVINRENIRTLARLFEDLTGKKASETPSGPFYDFVLAVYEGREDCRSLIHKALHNYPFILTPHK
jgi:hypothetical protein